MTINKKKINKLKIKIKIKMSRINPIKTIKILLKINLLEIPLNNTQIYQRLLIFQYMLMNKLFLEIDTKENLKLRKKKLKYKN